jgi:hypothetical protein
MRVSAAGRDREDLTLSMLRRWKNEDLTVTYVVVKGQGGVQDDTKVACMEGGRDIQLCCQW